MRRRAAVVVALLVLAAGCSGDDGGGGTEADEVSSTTAAPTTTVAPRGLDVAVPSGVEGPIEGGEHGVPYNPMPHEFADRYGYTEEEWFLSGEATAYVAAGPLGEDGAWAVAPGPTAPYTTRIIVRRPADDADFSGTVAVEWLNVSAGRDSDPDFGFLHPLLLEQGDAYVGVSAQATGVEGGGSVLEVPGVPPEALLPLKDWDPERYGDLDHPGDAFSYDIYSQVAALLRRPGDVDPLHGVRPQRVIAVGESQSAGRLATYVNGVHPIADVYDAFLVHSRGDGAASLNDDPADATPEPARLRTDGADPVLQVETETDLVGLGHLAARQGDEGNVMTWEIAGTAHADRSQIDYGRLSGEVWLPGVDVDPTASCGRINDGPQPEVVRAAYAALVAWAAEGTPPAPSPRIGSDADGLVRDELGNVVGGIRTPAVDAPISSLTGENPSDSVFCSLFGGSEPLTDAQLAERFEDHDDYVAQVTESADAAVEAGFLLPTDRDAIVAEAEAAPVP